MIPARTRTLLAAALLACTVPAQAATPSATPASPATQATDGIAWLSASSDADIERAFLRAKKEGKPLLLYWGAIWCPPCNQLKVTLFNRQDFIERTRGVVAVNLDGDLPGAQKLGARFKVRGYPTLILMQPDGTEITRLPGEADAPTIIAMLQQGLAGGRPLSQLIADVSAGRPLGSNDWRALALYAWDIDEGQQVSEAARPALLAQLAASCPPSEVASATRLMLKALAMGIKPETKPETNPNERLHALLADATASRAQMDALVNFAPDIVKTLEPAATPARATLIAAFNSALQRLENDNSLSRADRMGALQAQIDLARIDLPRNERDPGLPAALQERVRAAALLADREISNAYERQAVITSAAHVLSRAGLWAESDSLLKSSLARSHAPYYLMSQLGSNARHQGRSAEALDWYQQAFDKSRGPATRLQWGATLIEALITLAPEDANRIERSSTVLLDEAGKDRAAFYERSARSIARVAAKLAEWNTLGEHAPVLVRLNAKLDGNCQKIARSDPQHATCQRIAKSLAGTAL